MALELKANTAVDVLIGPFVDDTDGKTAEVALTISQADVLLSKNGQALTQKTDITAAAHDANGYYNCELDATDTNTEGQLVLTVSESGALPVRHEFNVLSQAAWDSKYAAKDTGYMDVNVKAVSEDTTAADNLELACDNYSATRGLSGTALPAAAADGVGGLPISDAGGLDLDTKLANTNEVTAARMGALTDWINGGRLDLILDAIAAGVNVTQIDGQATNGNNATLNLKQLNIVNSAGSAIIASATGGVGHGLYVAGNTAGHGIYSVGGVNGKGIYAQGGATSGAGIYAIAMNNNDAGMQLVKNGTGKDLDADETDAILADTNELQGDWTNTGRLDTILDSILDDTDLIDDGTSGLAKIATDVAAVLVDTGTSGVALADGVITAAKLGADCITNAKIADDAIATENLATGAIAADAVAATALNNIVMSDIAAGAPSATASIVTAINYLYEAWRNKTTTTATTLTLMKDDGSTTLVTSTISDDGTTFTKGEMT